MELSVFLESKTTVEVGCYGFYDSPADYRKRFKMYFDIYRLSDKTDPSDPLLGVRSQPK